MFRRKTTQGTPWQIVDVLDTYMILYLGTYYLCPVIPAGNTNHDNVCTPDLLACSKRRDVARSSHFGCTSRRPRDRFYGLFSNRVYTRWRSRRVYHTYRHEHRNRHNANMICMRQYWIRVEQAGPGGWGGGQVVPMHHLRILIIWIV